MSLQVWLPLNGNLNQQGILNLSNINNTSIVNNNGKIGKCYEFTSNQSQRFKGQFPTAISSPIGTIMGWFKFKNSTTWYNMIQIGNDGGFVTCVLSLYLWQGNKICLSLKGYDCTNSGCTTVYTIPNPISNTWYHIAASYDGTTAKIYLNGEEVLSAIPQLGSYTTGTYFYIGGTNNYYLNGFANDVRYYNDALTAEEIKKISQALILHWPLSGAPKSLQSYLHPRLPVAYQQIEYIEAINSAYLDTGYIADRYSTRIQCEMMPLDIADSAFFGNRGDYWCFYNIGSNYWYPKGYCETKTGPAMVINEKILIDWNKGIFEAWQGLHYERANRTVSSSIRDSDTMYLFNFHQIDGRRSYARIYWFKIWEDDIKVRDYIPAKRISDNVIGLYDLVNSTFITNVGPGSFTAGPNINFTPFSTFETIEYDCSGLNNYGNINVDAYTITQDDSSRYNKTYRFTSNYINSIAHSFDSFNFDECTISAWMKSTAKPSGYSGSIGIQHEGASGHKYLVLTNGHGGNLACYYTNGNYVTVKSDFLIDDGIWHHCVLTLINNTNLSLYVDGELKLNTTINWSNIPKYSDQHFCIGWDEPGSNELYNGSLSDIRFYTTALAIDEIQELYKMGRLN